MNFPRRVQPVDASSTPIAARESAEATPPANDAGARPGSAPLTAAERKSRWVVGGTIALLLLGGIGAYVAYKALSDTQPEKTVETPRVTVMVPGNTSIARTIAINGTIAARNELPVGPEGEGGRIVAVLAEAGDRVQRGQVLARLSTDLLRPQLAQIAGTLEEARADARLKRTDYERAVNVPGVLSQAEVDRRRAAADAADARVAVVRAQLREMEVRLARTDLRAPDNGLLLARSAEVGQMAMAGGTPLFRMAADSEIELRGQVAEQDMARLAVGMPVSVRLAGLDRTFEGRIRLLDPVIDPGTRLGGVRVALPSDRALRPGAFAEARISTGTLTTPVVPQSAVLADGEGPYVLVVGNDNRIARLRVRVGTVSSEGTAIIEGLSGTERVVTTAAAFLRPGELVEPIVPGQQPAAAPAPAAR